LQCRGRTDFLVASILAFCSDNNATQSPLAAVTVRSLPSAVYPYYSWYGSVDAGCLSSRVTNRLPTAALVGAFQLIEFMTVGVSIQDVPSSARRCMTMLRDLLQTGLHLRDVSNYAFLLSPTLPMAFIQPW
jgi:hypothetical protein